MRIVGGKFRGTALSPVGKGDTAAHLRPTTDRVRENIFNILTGGRFGDPIKNARCLDLFAGTGALGLEALSRGASDVTFVDQGRKAAHLITANIKLLGVAAQTSLLKADAMKFRATIPFELIFLDPPYGQALGCKALRALLDKNLIAQGATIIWEESSEQVPPPKLVLKDSRKYGDTHVTFLQADLEI